MTRRLETKFEKTVEEYERITSSKPRGALEYYMFILLRQGKSIQEAAQLAAAEQYRFDDNEYAMHMVEKCDRYELYGEW